MAILILVNNTDMIMISMPLEVDNSGNKYSRLFETLFNWEKMQRTKFKKIINFTSVI